MQNGNNSNLTSFYANNNPALTCIQVDNPTFMNTNFGGIYYIDAGASFSTNCIYPTNCNAQFTLIADSALQSVWYLVNQCMGTDSLSVDSLTYQWSWGDSLNSTSTGAYPSFSYSSPGNYTICVTITDTASGCTETYCDSSTYISRAQSQMIQVNVVPANSPLITSSPYSPPAPQGGSSVRCYPNPAKDVLYVEVGAACYCGLDPQFQIKITDLLGNEIHCNFKPVGSSSGKSPLSGDLEGLSVGIYFVKVNNDVVMFVKE